LHSSNWFGIVFILIGILGFIPGVTNADGMLLGIFQVDALHNVIHLLSGIVALLCAGSHKGAKSYFKIFGVIYALVTILGFVGGGNVLGLIMVNGADNALHLIIAVVALALGFGGPKNSMQSAPMMQQ
jgi:hypothetical protein